MITHTKKLIELCGHIFYKNKVRINYDNGMKIHNNDVGENPLGETKLEKSIFKDGIQP